MKPFATKYLQNTFVAGSFHKILVKQLGGAQTHFAATTSEAEISPQNHIITAQSVCAHSQVIMFGFKVDFSLW